MTDTAARDNAAGARRVLLDVSGMSCGACARRVQNRLNKLDGVQASVEIGTRIATIDADEHISVADLCAAVEQAGYQAEERSADNSGSGDSDETQLPQKQTLRAKFIRWVTFGHMNPVKN